MSQNDGPAPVVRLSPKGWRWWLTGHPWVYRDDLAGGEAVAGDLVNVLDHQGRPVGRAIYSAASRIALRFVTREDVPVNREFWQHRWRRALAWRQRVAPEAEARRLIFAEADGFPGLIVDSYAGHLVVQVHHPYWERCLPELQELLHLDATPASITWRNDSEVRLLEGLPQGVETVAGTLPDRILVREGAVQFWVDVRHGQKTGMFLDQRENRQAAAAWAAGEVLDCFSYQGGFALHLAAGARQVTAVETSAAALSQARDNARLNGRDNISWVQQNCFEFLKAAVAAGRRYDLIVLDPPAFARSRGDRRGAHRGYKEINRRALQLLHPGGVLLTCSCSYNVSESEFVGLLREASRDAGRQARLIEHRGASRDHPALLSLPESVYLKCYVLGVD